MNIFLGKWKTMEHEGDGYTNCNWYRHQKIITGPGGLANQRTSGYHPNYSITKIGQNTKKSPADLSWYVVAQTPVRNHYSMLA